MGITKELRFIKREDWFQPVLNVHTPLSSPRLTILLFAALQLRSYKDSS